MSADPLPIQLRQQKNQWSRTEVPKGRIQDIIANFSKVKKTGRPELVNTGKKNRFMVHNDQVDHDAEMERLTRADYEAKKAKADAKRLAAIKLQAAARRMKAQKILKRKQEIAEAQKRKEEADRLAALEKEREEEERLRREAEERERKEREAMDAEERKRREAEEAEQRRKDEAARKLLLADQEKMAAIKIQAMVRAALTREKVRIMVEKLIEELLAAEAEAAATREAEEAEQRALREAEEARLRKERAAAYFKKYGLFVGPIDPEVALLTKWWMESVPHKTYQAEHFDDAMNELWEKSLEQRFFQYGLLTQARQESLLGGGYRQEEEEEDGAELLEIVTPQGAEPEEEEEEEEVTETEHVEILEEDSVVDEVYYDDEEGSIVEEEVVEEEVIQ